MNNDDRELDFALAESEQENRLLKQKVADYEGLIRDLTEALRAQAVPPPPMECKTDAEKIAYAYGWFKALELNPARKLWVGLTGGEVLDVLVSVDKETVRLPSMLGIFARAIEAKLKEKNT